LSASGAAAGSSLRAAEILGARQFFAAVVDHVVTGESRRDERAQLGDLYLNKNRCRDQKSLQHIGGEHDAQGN
jgi:hypothetical protein